MYTGFVFLGIALWLFVISNKILNLGVQGDDLEVAGIGAGLLVAAIILGFFGMDLVRLGLSL